MATPLVQIEAPGKDRSVLEVTESGMGMCLHGVRTVRELALVTIDERVTLPEAIAARRTPDIVDLAFLPDEIRLLAPIDHPDPAHLHLTGTGLTHLGSAESRDKMHAIAASGAAQTDSMRIFLQGLAGGKPAAGSIGVRPEWFYKGNGFSVAPPGSALEMPSFALDGGEEPELAGIYLIDSDGNPYRLGFCLANEFSDHVTERENYLWLAHSKLRQAALGPELLLGPPTAHITGTSKIERSGKVIWEKPFLTGEDNMSHSIANLEHHRFKYPIFRRPGDLHVHFFGCATLSHSDGLETEEGGIFDIRADVFSLPLRNELTMAANSRVSIRVLYNI